MSKRLAVVVLFYTDKEALVKRDEVKQILARDMPGWNISPRVYVPDIVEDTFTVSIVKGVNGKWRKIVTIANGRVIGSENMRK